MKTEQEVKEQLEFVDKQYPAGSSDDFESGYMFALDWVLDENR